MKTGGASGGSRGGSLSSLYDNAAANDDDLEPTNVDDLNDEMPSRPSPWYQCCLAFSSQIFNVDDLLKMFPHGSVDIEDLKKFGVAVPITIFYLVVFSIAFIYLLTTSLNSALAAQTLSLDGSNAAQMCTPMPVTLSGSWNADSRGFWSTQSGFSANLSVYTIEFRATSLTLDD